MTASHHIGLRLTGAAYRALQARARRAGYSTTGYGQLLFDAAFAARIGQEREGAPVDGELDEQIRLVFCMAGQANTHAIAKATGIPEQRVERILEGFRVLRTSKK